MPEEYLAAARRQGLINKCLLTKREEFVAFTDISCDETFFSPIAQRR